MRGRIHLGDANISGGIERPYSVPSRARETRHFCIQLRGVGGIVRSARHSHSGNQDPWESVSAWIPRVLRAPLQVTPKAMYDNPLEGKVWVKRIGGGRVLATRE